MCGRLMSPAHETQSMRETLVKRGRVIRYGKVYLLLYPICLCVCVYHSVNMNRYAVTLCMYVCRYVCVCMYMCICICMYMCDLSQSTNYLKSQ